MDARLHLWDPAGPAMCLLAGCRVAGMYTAVTLLLLAAFLLTFVSWLSCSCNLMNINMMNSFLWYVPAVLAAILPCKPSLHDESTVSSVRLLSNQLDSRGQQRGMQHAVPDVACAVIHIC